MDWAIREIYNFKKYQENSIEERTGKRIFIKNNKENSPGYNKGRSNEHVFLKEKTH